MRLFPAVNLILLMLLPAAPALAQAQAAPMSAAQLQALQAQSEAATQAAMAAMMQQQGMGVSPAQAAAALQQAGQKTGSLLGALADSTDMKQGELDERLRDRNSPQYKASRLAKDAEKTLDLFGRIEAGDESELYLIDGRAAPPPEMESLQRVHQAQGQDMLADDPISKDMALDIRRDSQKEAARSYGARGGLAKRAYQIMEQMAGYAPALDKVFDFRQLLIRAPSGLMIEPPIVSEALEAIVITDRGNEAAVADQVLKINKQAKIVTAPRDWRQYLVMHYDTLIAPPPRVLWPKDAKEQAEWNQWVREGWDAGYKQGDEIFETSLNRLTADYNGMVRYRMLLAEGKISQPFAMQEDRGVTGGKNEMRVGDRALRITGPSEFLTGAGLWKPADR